MNDERPQSRPEHIIRNSWQRCREFGLAPEARLPERMVSRANLSDGLEANHRLIAYAQPVLENLYRQISRSSSLVLLTDDGGMILRSVGDTDFVGRAARVALAPGNVWSEDLMGTNAIGTALRENKSVAVCGDEHYYLRNRFLTCVSTPILAPTGGVVGILDISSDARVTHAHATALLETTAEIIENRLTETVAGGFLTVRFHPVVEALGTPLQGIVVFDEKGLLIACNRRAKPLLRASGLVGRNFEACFALPWSMAVGMGRQYGSVVQSLLTTGGAALAASFSAPFVTQRARHIGVTQIASKRAMGLDDLNTGDPRMEEALRRATRIASRDIPLLIQGETGTGKEIFARAFHQTGLRRNGPFVAINCAAIPAALLETELFGYVDGAYTGARRDGSRGKLREANGGTVFLDEIGDMPLPMQAVLLRVLETRRVAPLGSCLEEAVDFGLVCASHRPLKELTECKLFREDLFFRLSGMTVTLPTLRERADFEALVRRFLDDELPSRKLHVAPEAMAALRHHPWPGNLRQLRNALRLAVALLGDEERLERGHLPTDVLEDGLPGDGDAHSPALRAAEARMVRDAVTRHGGNISAAARELGITRTTVYRKLRQ